MSPLLPLLALAAAVAPGLPKSWQPPKGWEVERFAEGDLNHDGRPDLAVVLSTADNKVELVIYLQQADGTWREHTTSEEAVCFTCAGPKGPPVAGDPAITDKGILEMTYFGGGGDLGFESVAKFRLDAKDHFILIGYTYKASNMTAENGSLEAGLVDSKDVNLSTLKMVETISGHKKPVTCRVDKKLQGIELSMFSFTGFNVDDCLKQP
jgi:hypothetical protein